MKNDKVKFRITDAEKNLLDERKKAHKKGDSKSYTVKQMTKLVKQTLK